MRDGLTIAMIVRDEAQNLSELLPSLSAVDEVVVVDTGSEDDSIGIARQLGATVIRFPWCDDFSKARNRGLEAVTTSHTCWLDADDRMDSQDVAQIRDFVCSKGPVGVWLTLVSPTPNPSITNRCEQLRVFPTRTEHRFVGRIHEQIAPSLERTRTPTHHLAIEVRHVGYPTAEELNRKARRNLELSRLETAAADASVSSRYHHVKSAVLCGEVDEAIRIARDCLARNAAPTDEDILQNLRVTLGNLHWQQKDYEAARMTYANAVERCPRDPLARFHFGEFLRKSGRPGDAVAHLRLATELPALGNRVPLPLDALRQAARSELAQAEEQSASCEPQA